MLTRFLVVCFCSLSFTAHAEELNLSRFERTTILGGLVQPMELDIAPDGRIFLIELGGRLLLIEPHLGDVTEVGKLEVTTAQENGLIGLALDPDFADNGWLYLQYSPPSFSGQYVSRFTFRDDKLDMDSEKILFSYEEQRRECCHHAGSLEFGPEGHLYIGTGDNTNPFNDSQGYAPIDERSDRQPWDAQRSAGNTKSYNGKVLRIHPESDGTYSIPDGNLFPKDGSIGHPEIYVMGCRNPWRINVDPKSGFLYWGDVGPDAGNDNERGSRGYDEINQAKVAGNFGWPYFIGNNFAYSMIDFATGTIHEKQNPAQPQNHSVNNTGAKTLPPALPAMIYYPSASSSEFPAMGSGGRTACAGPVYYFDEDSSSTTKFPRDYDRTLFAFEWSRSMLMACRLDHDSNLKQLERFLPEMSFTRPIDMQFDHNGSLVMIEYGETWGVNPDARLVRIDYVRGNRSPMAVAEAKNSVGREPLTVQLSAAGSSDKDGDKLTYQWTAIRTLGDEQQRQLIADTETASTVFSEPGVFTIELLVTDSAGAQQMTSLPVVVGNARPEVAFVEPRDGDFFTPGKPVPYRLVVRDTEDGTSDLDQAEEDGWHLIEGTAPSRLFTEAIAVSASGELSTEVPPGLALIRQSDCLNCHAVDRQLVGPAFLDIAKKYRDQPHQIEQSVTRVREGSTGVWGKIGMLPHVQHSAAEIRQMVEYVFSVKAGVGNPTAQGFNNELLAADASGAIRLEASYTDLGRDDLSDIPKLTGVGSVTLRNQRVQAEAANEYRGTQSLGSGEAEGKQFMGGIEHNGFLRFDHINLADVSSVTVRVTSAGAGGVIELHSGSVDGELLGSTPVEVNGSWDAFYEKEIELTPIGGTTTLYVVFKNEANRGGLMNIDCLEFNDEQGN